MFQPHTITLNTRLVLISRHDGADYHGPVPLRIRLNLLRYSVTLWPGTPSYRTINKGGWLARKMANALFRLRGGWWRMHNIIHQGTLAFLAIAPRRTILTNWFQWYLGKVYYRFWCPGGGQSVRDCIAKGDCGCDNSPTAVRVSEQQGGDK